MSSSSFFSLYFVRGDSFKGRLLSLLDTERLSIGTTKNLTVLQPSCSYRQSSTSLLSLPHWKTHISLLELSFQHFRPNFEKVFAHRWPFLGFISISILLIAATLPVPPLQKDVYATDWSIKQPSAWMLALIGNVTGCWLGLTTPLFTD